MKNLVYVWLAVFGSFVCSDAFIGSKASAAITYDLALRLPGEAASIDGSFAATPGQTFMDVEVLLIETVTAGSVSPLGDNSLDGSPVPNRNGNIAGYQANLAAAGLDGFFSDLTLDATGGVAGPANDGDTLGYLAIGNAFGTPGKMATLTSPSVREVLLGTVDLTAPSMLSTTFTVSDFSGADGDFTTFGTGSLEAAANGSGGSFNNRSLTLNVTAVPEPSSIAALAVIGGVVAARRRRKSSQAVKASS